MSEKKCHYCGADLREVPTGMGRDVVAYECPECVEKAKRAESDARNKAEACPICGEQAKPCQGPADLSGKAYMRHCAACGYKYPVKITW